MSDRVGAAARPAPGVRRADAGRSLEVGTTDDDGIEYFFEAEHVLVATGRVPNSDTLDLAATGVEVDDDGA